LARFFTNDQASDSISAAERSIDKRAELIERRVADSPPSSQVAPPFDFFSFFSSTGCLVSLNEVTLQC
jgi:hypothetical protein